MKAPFPLFFFLCFLALSPLSAQDTAAKRSSVPILSGLEAGLSLGWPGLVGLTARGEDLDLGLSLSAYRDLASRSAVSLGLGARTNFVNGGLSLQLAFRKSLHVKGPFALEVLLAAFGGYRSVGYPLMSYSWHAGGSVGFGMELQLGERLALVLNQGIALSWWEGSRGLGYPLGLGIRWRTQV